jgi:hypothetical protein
MHQVNLHYEKNCNYTFGSYVQAHDEPNPKNDLTPRTLDCVYLRYTDSHQSGHELLNIFINRVIVQYNISVIPILKAIIEQINKIAKDEKMPTRMKIHNKSDMTIDSNKWNNEDESSEEEEDSITQDYEDTDPDEIMG